jgi:biopolymer transport protein ExbB
MKLIVALYGITSLLFAEDRIDLLSLEQKTQEEALPVMPSEELAKQEIESFFQTVTTQDIVDPALNPPPVVIKEAAPSPVLVADVDMEQLEAEVNGPEPKMPGVVIDLNQVFSGSPVIYSVLFLLSIASLGIGLYTWINLRTPQLSPKQEVGQLREKLSQEQYDEALALCKEKSSLLLQMVATGIATRSHGKTTMLDMMHAEGKRVSSTFWQKLALLNDIAIIAPMLGLLGTVLGMFYAFYDLNRSMESISALFDGLGISVGTTVCGLVVAIIALIFYSLTKYRLVKQLAYVENEAQSLANLIHK